jgi:virginiamycin A acetyltransferase
MLEVEPDAAAALTIPQGPATSVPAHATPSITTEGPRPAAARGAGGKEAALGDWLFRLYGRVGGRLRAQIRKQVLRWEGNELYSVTLRRIFSKYHGVDVGLFTGGAAFQLHAMAPGTTIGRYCTITMTARTFTANHPMNTRSTHALFYNPRLGLVDREIIPRTNLVIGNDVWIGHNAIILSSTTSIGDGAIIGAGTVVNRDVPPYAVVVGHPGKVVRYRFSESVIADLLAERWWDKSPDEVRAMREEFQRPLDGGPVR